MPDYLPTFEELEYLRRQINPFERQLKVAWDYINSNRGTMGQGLAFSQDEDAIWDDYN